MAGEQEEVTVDVSLHDYLSASAERAARATEELSRQVKQLNRQLLTLEKRADKAARAIEKYGIACSMASHQTQTFGGSVAKTGDTMKNYTKEVNKNSKEHENHTKTLKEAEKAQNNFGGALKNVWNVVKGAIPAFRMLGIVIGVMAAAGAAASGVQGILGLAGSLTTLLSLAALVPAAVTTLIGSFIVLKVATSGFSDAISAAFSGNEKKFEKALEKLSPLAQTAVKDLAGFIPAFKDIKNATQDGFVYPFMNWIKPLLQNLIPELRAQMRAAAVDIGNIVRTLFQFGASTKGVELLELIFGNIQRAAHALNVALGPFLNGLFAVMTTVNPQFQNFLMLVGQAGVQFGLWLSRIAADGSLEGFLTNAIDLIKQLWNVGKEVFGILHDLIAGLGTDGAGMLMSLLKPIHDFTSSAQGMATLQAIFSALEQIGAALAPVIVAIAQAIGTALAPAIGPIVQNLAPALIILVQALSQGLQALLPVWGPLSQAVAALVVALAPLLPMIGQIAAVLLTNLAYSVQVLAPIIGALLQVALTPLMIIFQAFGMIVAANGPLINQIITTLAQTFAMLLPVIAQLAQIFLAQFIQFLPQLAFTIQQVIPPFLQLVPIIGGLLVQALVALLPYFPPLVNAFFQVLAAVLPNLPLIAQLIVLFLQLLIALSPLIPVFVAVAGVVLQLAAASLRTLAVIIDFSTAVFRSMSSIISSITGALSGVVSAFSTPFSQAKDVVMGIIYTIKAAISDVLGSISNIGSTARNIAGNVLGALNPFRAFGGPVEAGRKYTVGEIGRELFVPNVGSPKYIGMHGMETWSSPMSGTIIPSYVVDAMERAAKAAERDVAAIEARSGRSGGNAALEAVYEYMKRGGGDTPSVTLDMRGATFSKDVDVEKAVDKAMSKWERDRRERQ